MTKQTLKICLTTVQSLLVDDDDDVLFKLILVKTNIPPISFCLRLDLGVVSSGGLLILHAI